MPTPSLQVDLPGTPTGTRGSQTTSSTTTVRRSTASRCGTGTGRALPGTTRPALSKPSSSVKPRPRPRSSLGLARFLCFVQTEHAKVFVPLRHCSFTKPSQLSSHTNPYKEYCSIESIEHFILVQEDVWLKHAVVFLDYFGVQCKCRLLNKLLLII